MRFARLCQYGAALLWAIACHADARSTDGNTSWVAMCKTSADCSGKMTCECGVCTSVCAMNAVCGGQSACAKAGSSAFTTTCGDESTLAGVCLPRCPEEGCGPGRSCTGGLCTPLPIGDARPDAGSPRDASPGTGGTASSIPASGGTPGSTPGPGGSGGKAGGSGGRPGSAGSGGRGVDAGSGGSAGNLPEAGPEPNDGDPGPLATCDSFDDPRLRNGPIVSLRNDLLPIFGISCVTSDCHSPTDQKAGLNLGYKCAYDINAKWKCTFPLVPNPDPSYPQPVDEQTVAQIYASLLAPAMTVTSGLVKRVAPGDPANSFLVLSLADKQNSRGYVCENQDPSHESNPPRCGVFMPQNQEVLCNGTYQPRFDAVVRWIAQGARNN